MKPPFSYEYMNATESLTSPASIQISGTPLAAYFKKYLMQEALAVFDWTLPEHWDADYFRYILMGWGYLAVIKTDLFGVIPQQCTLSGINVFYRPTLATIANPLITASQLTIGEDCEIIRLMPDYSNVSDLVGYYGDLLALCYVTLSTNILNSKLSFAFRAESEAEAQTYQALYDNIASGRPAVFYRSKKPPASTSLKSSQPWDTFSQNLAQNYIAPELLETIRSIKDQFLTDIGIPNLSTRKRERVNLLEAEKNDVETACKARLWLVELRDSIARVKAMFPSDCANLSVKLRFEGGALNDSQSLDTRSILL